MFLWIELGYTENPYLMETLYPFSTTCPMFPPSLWVWKAQRRVPCRDFWGSPEKSFYREIYLTA